MSVAHERFISLNVIATSPEYCTHEATPSNVGKMVSRSTVVVIPQVIRFNHESKILPDRVTAHSLNVEALKFIVIVGSLLPVLIYVSEIVVRLVSISSTITISPESKVPLNCMVTS